MNAAMFCRGTAIIGLFLFFHAGSVFSIDANAPEAGSDELEVKKKEQPLKIDPKLPNVMIIGDSISLSYTPIVAELLKGKANVVHSKGNSNDTATGVACVKKWVTQVPGVEKWDVIHFNWGLHDLKRVKRNEKGIVVKFSDDPSDPPNNDIAKYEENMRKVVADLKATGAKLIFATTTPYPAGVKPARVPEDAVKYNEVALKIMKEENIEVDDLYTAILPKLAELQMPVNVHFKPEGSKFLAKLVAESIMKSLNIKENK